MPLYACGRGSKGSRQRPVNLSSRKGTNSSGSPYGSSPACAPNMTVCPASWPWRTEYRFLWLLGMTRATDGSTRWINLPFCVRTTQLKSPLCVARLVLPLNPETAVWSSDKLLVNQRYCSMCIDVPESTTAPGDCWTFVCSTIRQLCVCVRACINQESRYWYLSLLMKVLALMISISLCTTAQEWTAHLWNPLSFGGYRHDVWFDGRLAEVDVENVCVAELGVRRVISTRRCLVISPPLRDGFHWVRGSP